MPAPNGNGKIETNNYKKQRRWSLIGILSKKKKFKKSQESVDFCPYDGKINQKVAQNNHLERSTDCLIEQYTCSPRLIRRCNSLQYTSQVAAYSNTTSQPSLNEWKSSQQSVYSSSSSACYSDIGVYKSYENSNRSSYYIKEENEEPYPVRKNVPNRCSSENGYYQNKTNYNQRYSNSSVNSKKLIGKKIPPPPPPRDPNVKAVYYFRNNRLMSRESDSTYFSQGSDDNIPDNDRIYENEIDCPNVYYRKEPARSRRPIQICDVETLSTESKKSVPRIQTAEEALQELEDIYNSLGLSDEDLLDRAERRDLPTLHQNMRYQSYDELDCVDFRRVLPKTRRSGVPDIVSDDMAFRRLNRRESKRQNVISGSFLLVLPTVYNLDKNSKSPGEPDITLDDVVFRSRRQHLNFLKISDPQPPFGIPLGPIVGAAPSDYLHAVPEGRYKPSFHPRKMPDTVEDDLAFRTLRKDFNKYKTYIDFSFIHRNRFARDDQRILPRPGGNRIKHDAHWIIKARTTPSDRIDNVNNDRRNQVKQFLDGLSVDSIAVATDRAENLMLVKINHHKPIMLTGFNVNEANQLSKSLFRTNLSLLHEPSPPLPSKRAPHLIPYDRSFVNAALTGKRATTSPPAAVERFKKGGYNDTRKTRRGTKKSTSSSYTPQVMMQMTGSDGDGLTTCKSVMVNRNQPNFRELIEREYAQSNRRPSTDRDEEIDSRPVNSTDDRTNNDNDVSSSSSDIIGRRTVGSAGAIVVSRSATGGEDHLYHLEPPVVTAATWSPENASGNRTETTSPTTVDDHQESSPSSDQQQGCMPGYSEVCLYIAIYIYQLFSVNAYSTVIALIFLVALHVCRRLS